MKKLGLILAIAMIFSFSANAQRHEGFGGSVRLGGVLPMQDFAATQAYVVPGINGLGNHGCAMFGASLGLEGQYMFGLGRDAGGLGIFLSADAMWNALNKNIRDQYSKVSCTKPTYINVPILLGVKYISDFSDVVDVWAEAGVGVNLFKKTTEGWNNSTVSYDMTASFAAGAGIGVTFVDVVSIGVYYNWLGKQKIKVEGITYDETYVVPHQMKSGVMDFRIGFHF